MTWTPMQTTLVGISTIVTLYVLYTAQQALLVVLFATLLAIGYCGLLSYISKQTGVSHSTSFIGTLLMAGLLGGGLGWYIWPQLQTQIAEFSTTSDAFVAADILPQFIPTPDTSIQTMLQSNSTQIVSELQSVFSASLSFGTFLIVIVFIMLYGAWNKHLYLTALQRLKPSLRPSVTKSISVASTVTQKWLLGRVLSMVIVGVLTYAGLWLLGVPIPLFLAVISGLLSFIPNIGPIISVVPAILVVAGSGLTQIGLVIGLYVLIQFIESYFITPSIQKNLIAVPPALLLGAQLIMGALFGLLGLLLAAPLVAILIAVVKEQLQNTTD